MLRIEGLNKAFVDRKRGTGLIALRNIDLEIEDGEFVCLIGPSGCGKTTLLNLIAGFESPTRGGLSMDGRVISGPGTDRAVVFQETSLFPWMSVLENVEFALRAKTKDAAERKRTAAEALSLVGLSDFLNARPNDLSGGMKQRVAIARAFAMDPRTLLMDEPFSSLDEQTRRKLDNDISSIWLKKKKTIVFVTHSLDEAIYLGSRVVMFSPAPGQIVKEWRIDLPRPRDMSSKAFIGLREEMRSTMRSCECADGGVRNRFIEVKEEI